MASSQAHPSRSLSPVPPIATAPPPPPPQFVQATPPPPPTDGAVISRAPVRYDVQQPTDADDRGGDSFSPTMLGSGEEGGDQQPRSKRPGQAGFAQRLMSKYGWTKGTGLGANESGIVNPLRVQVEKRRKKADADGGGWAEPGGKGKILGGKRKDEDGKFGKMSEVIVLRNMLENMPDLQSEIANGLGQEIGEECGEKVSTILQYLTPVCTDTDRYIVRPCGAPLHRSERSAGLYQVHRSGVRSSSQCILLKQYEPSPADYFAFAGCQRARRTHLQRQHHCANVLRRREFRARRLHRRIDGSSADPCPLAGFAGFALFSGDQTFRRRGWI